ncbi:MAG: hypothetical protein D6795_04180 [Deltaproteobacteria bacterium]|nr:MAG: hypothetical protein D6795_04180 [Deltaproteobacteria bacterium]
MMIFFAFLLVVIFQFTFEPGKVNLTDLAPGLLWVMIVFSGLLGFSRSFAKDLEHHGLSGMAIAPIDPGAIYLGKTGANVCFLLAMEGVMLPLLGIFLNAPVFSNLLRIVPVVVLGTVGFASVGTLFASISVHTRLSEVILPLLLLPIVVPLLIFAVKATGRVMVGRSLADVATQLKFLAGIDLMFLALSFLLFEYTLTE